jgi:hypothetical protein
MQGISAAWLYPIILIAGGCTPDLGAADGGTSIH